MECKLILFSRKFSPLTAVLNLKTMIKLHHGLQQALQTVKGLAETKSWTVLQKGGSTTSAATAGACAVVSHLHERVSKEGESRENKVVLSLFIKIGLWYFQARQGTCQTWLSCC